MLQIAGLQVAVWKPSLSSSSGSATVIFSHSAGGQNTQSTFLMKALSAAGYLVIAPNHRNAPGESGASEFPGVFANPDSWSYKSYRDRGNDIKNLIDALRSDARWNRRIDWSRLVLCGHSLGGYTVLGCAGAWPSWKIAGIKAVLALAPYAEPYAVHKTLRNLSSAVMYQSGTNDQGVTYYLKRKGGTFSQTPSPAYLVVLDRATHTAFCDSNTDTAQKELIKRYSLAFLNKHVLSDASAKPGDKFAGVNEMQAK